MQPGARKVSIWLSANRFQIRLLMVVVYTLAAFLAFALVHALNVWRVDHFPHAKAFIASVWNEEVRMRGGTRTETFGRILFTRQHAGKTYECNVEMNLGLPSDHILADTWIDVVPKTGTCYHPLITKRVIG